MTAYLASAPRQTPYGARRLHGAYNCLPDELPARRLHGVFNCLPDELPARRLHGAYNCLPDELHARRLPVASSCRGWLSCMSVDGVLASARQQ
jgi:hypothetical protein